MELSFGEQLKIILKRKNMTIQDLANLYESQTGTKMTRQNLSQRIRRDNFQEQDMHLLAGILGFQVSIQLTPAAAQTVPMTAAISLPSQPVIPTAQKVTTADGSTMQIPNLLRKPVIQGDINPLTGEEYLTNTVRKHPTLESHVQVYDRTTHEWSDVNEDYFWEFQANKKELLGSDYREPIVI